MSVSIDPYNKTYYPDINSTPKKEINNDMGKDAFLQILVQQLKNQDPLSPTDNDKFIAQMTQFNVLEQLINMNSQLEELNKVVLSMANNEAGEGENVE